MTVKLKITMVVVPMRIYQKMAHPILGPQPSVTCLNSFISIRTISWFYTPRKFPFSRSLILMNFQQMKMSIQITMWIPDPISCLCHLLLLQRIHMLKITPTWIPSRLTFLPSHIIQKYLCCQTHLCLIPNIVTQLIQPNPPLLPYQYFPRLYHW